MSCGESAADSTSCATPGGACTWRRSTAQGGRVSSRASTKSGVGEERPRARGAGHGVGLEDEDGGADLDGVAGGELHRFVRSELPAADDGAVGAAEIDETHGVAGGDELRVAAGDGVVDADLHVVATAGGDGAFGREGVRGESGLADESEAPAACGAGVGLRLQSDGLEAAVGHRGFGRDASGAWRAAPPPKERAAVRGPRRGATPAWLRRGRASSSRRWCAGGGRRTASRRRRGGLRRRRRRGGRGCSRGARARR